MTKKILATVLSLVLVVGCMTTLTGCGSDSAEDNGELNIYMWSDYISEDLIANFEDEYGITVNMTYMSSSDEAVAKLVQGASDYDLVMPCDADMTTLIEGGYIQEINKDNIPNFEYVGDDFKGKECDPDNDYHMPYLSNYVYVIYDTSAVSEPTCYNDLLNEEYTGKIGSANGSRNLIPLALVAQGLDPNSTDEDELDQAEEWLYDYVAQCYNIGDDLAPLCLSGAISVAFTFDGTASKVMADEAGDNWEVAHLTDAIQLGNDDFVIPTGAANVENAEKFLNYILDPEVMAENLETCPYSCPNPSAVELASEEYRSNRALNFYEDMKANVFFQEDIGDASTRYDEIYTKILASAN